MTEKYPLLTVQNVQYWYQERDPPKSGHDIAKEVGCCYQNVYNFMRAHNIAIRDYSESGKVRFQDPEKYEAMMEIKRDPEYRRKESESNSKLWTSAEKRKQKSEEMKKISEKWLSDYQKIILFLMQNEDKKFLREITTDTGLNKKCLNRNLRFLCRRGLMKCEKEFDTKLKRKQACNHYFITLKGIKILKHNQKHNPFEYDNIIEHIKNNKKTNGATRERNKSYIGKNQRILLMVLNDNEPMFARELQKMTNLSLASIDGSLRLLCKRMLVVRKKEVDLASVRNNKNSYRYSIIENGSSLIESAEAQYYKKAKAQKIEGI